MNVGKAKSNLHNASTVFIYILFMLSADHFNGRYGCLCVDKEKKTPQIANFA